ncbi:MBL fold metallo-hydrolase [Aggregatilinea lenta]|uniref:MBL fold metallo-hydrolase n=1 Tax=Aggregatilinea lenta TaxID=913108 RepID=UPI000E5A588C|nr:MBL fold metallo-hydrolase [Aggregatilinea lenta]
MARLIVLGSAAAVSDAAHDNTHFVLQGDHGSVVLVDCGSNPLVRLKQCDLLHDDLTDVILTHFHPDHVGSLPLMLMQLWLLGRKNPLHIYGLPHCIRGVENMMAGFEWESWPEFFLVAFHRVPERDGVLLLDNDDFRIISWPTRHFLPTIGFRVEVKTSGKTIGYSCDTEPVPAITALAQDVDLLLHEASGEGAGHSSAAQAGQVASEANAKRLELIHYTVSDHLDTAALAAEARTTFAGPIGVAQDFAVYEI